MEQLTRIFRFFVFSNLFISLCALAMTWQVYYLFNITDPKRSAYLGFVFFATVLSYSFHWYLTTPSLLPTGRTTWTLRYRRIHVLLFLAGVPGTAWFFFLLREHWLALLIAAAITFLYSAPKIPHPWFRALRRIAIGKTIFLAMMWMYATTILPVLVTNHEWSAGLVLFCISRFFLVYAICILFDFRDREDDKAAGIRSLITYFNEKGIRILFAFSLLVFSGSTAALGWEGIRVEQVAILLLPGMITAVLYRYARNHFQDMLYYFVLDGLMALSAFILWIARI